MLQATLANVNRAKSVKPYTAEQFMPKWGVAKRQAAGPMDPYELLRAVKKANRALGGEEVKRADGDAR
jgi:hypothetical protein